MRISDLTRIALKTLKGRWAVIPAVAIVISMFCLCCAGAILTTVNDEKSQPYELSVSAGASKLSDENAAKISKFTGVSSVTPVIQAPEDINIGEYSAQLTLSGIQASYLNGAFDKGGIFPDSSVMPYIVLNKAACRLFTKNADNDTPQDSSVDNSDDQGTEATAAPIPDIDWLNTVATLQAEEGTGTVTVKICGILSKDDKDEQPAAYISLNSAKQLLSRTGEDAAYSEIRARVENMGFAANVSSSIVDLGLTVENSNSEQQSKWDRESDEMVYLTIVGAFSLICFAVLMIMLRKVSLLEHKVSWQTLKWIGFREKDISNVFLLRSLLILMIGIISGIIISLSLPSFLPPELKDVSVLMLSIPFWPLLICAAICIAAGMLSMIGIRKMLVNILS